MNQRRMALAEAQVRAASAEICARVLPLCEAARAQTVALFAAIRNEVDLAGLGAELRARGVAVAYPRVEAPAQLTFHRVDDPARLVPGGRFRIPEPPPAAPLVPAEQLEVVVVPGLAFDSAGHRVGWGAGYYDALLPRAARARRIGVCFDFQLVEACPRGEADQPVHVVVTERQTVDVTLSPSTEQEKLP